MKGIEMCADCAYYDMKKHKCERGCTVDPDISKGHDVRFYVDCPLPDVQEVRHGQWSVKMLDIGGGDKIRMLQCSECSRNANMKFDFCPTCGARMDGGAEE